MKNKKLLYLLLPLTALVWGLVIYKIMQTLDTSGEKVFINSAKTTLDEDKSVAPDTFNLLLNYRDPFLANRPFQKRVSNGGLPIKTNAVPLVSSFKASTTTNTTVTTTANVWPTIEYRGIIENSNNKSKIAMILINEATYLLPEGQKVTGIKLFKILSDSILVEYNMQKKYILKFKI